VVDVSGDVVHPLTARTLCPFPEYSPVFQNAISIVSEDPDGCCSVSEGPDEYCMVSGYRGG
jgi:hypothetical protein